jgi:hypothetical protein
MEKGDELSSSSLTRADDTSKLCREQLIGIASLAQCRLKVQIKLKRFSLLHVVCPVEMKG